MVEMGDYKYETSTANLLNLHTNVQYLNFDLENLRILAQWSGPWALTQWVAGSESALPFFV